MTVKVNNICEGFKTYKEVLNAINKTYGKAGIDAYELCLKLYEEETGINVQNLKGKLVFTTDRRGPVSAASVANTKPAMYIKMIESGEISALKSLMKYYYNMIGDPTLNVNNLKQESLNKKVRTIKERTEKGSLDNMLTMFNSKIEDLEFEDFDESCKKKSKRKTMKEYADEIHGVITCNETGEEYGYSDLQTREYIVSDLVEKGYTYKDRPISTETGYFDESNHPYWMDDDVGFDIPDLDDRDIYGDEDFNETCNMKEARGLHTWNITYTGRDNKIKNHIVDAPDAYEANRKARRELGISYNDIDDVSMVENKNNLKEDYLTSQQADIIYKELKRVFDDFSDNMIETVEADYDSYKEMGDEDISFEEWFRETKENYPDYFKYIFAIMFEDYKDSAF